MKLDLKYPYSNDWKRGYLQVNGEGRKTVILYNHPDDRSSTSYARYLKSVELGRYLSSEEQVDHRDDDKTNDVISNLQILTVQENNAKQGSLVKKVIVLTCDFCGKDFVREARQTHKKSKNNFCKRSCLYSFMRK